MRDAYSSIYWVGPGSGRSRVLAMYAGPSPLAAAEQYLEQIASRDFAGIEQYFAEDKPHPTSAELEEGFRRLPRLLAWKRLSGLS